VQLEPLLLTLDRAVRAAHSDAIHTTSGFAESIVETLGEKTENGRLKYVSKIEIFF
jgi:hypothetical protein